MLDAQASGSRENSAIPLLLLGVAARVVYEGMHVLRNVELDVDLSTLLKHAPADLDLLVERARHASKLLDDTKRSTASTVALLEQYQLAQHRSLHQATPRHLRWLATDLGLITTNGRVLAATVPLQLRLGLPPDATLDEAGPFLQNVAEQMGRALSVLAAVDLDFDAYTTEPRPVSLPGLRTRDVDTAHYLKHRFEPAAPQAVKLTVLMISSELQVSARLLPLTASPSSPAVSRARLISLIHSVRGIRTLIDGGFLQINSDAGERVRASVESAAIARFASNRGLRYLRNQYVHYIYRGEESDLDPSLPDFGVAALLTGGLSMEQVDREVIDGLTELADAVSAWSDARPHHWSPRWTQR